MQRIRIFFFLSFLTVILVLLGSIFGKEGMIIALIFALLMNFFSYWFSDRIVRRLSQTAGLPMPKIYIFPSSTPNAFATGRNPQHSAVAVSAGILQMLSDEEISGVLGHELSLANKRIPMAGVNPATSHLFIVNPFSKKSIFNLFSTHPPIEEWIKHLENLRL